MAAGSDRRKKEMKKIIEYDYPWCASPTQGLKMAGRVKAFIRLVKGGVPLKANIHTFSED